MEFSINILSLAFSDGLHVSVTVTPWCFNLVLFSSNDLTLAATWLRTNVSVSDGVMVTIGSCCTSIWRLLYSVVWLIIL